MSVHYEPIMSFQGIPDDDSAHRQIFADSILRQYHKVIEGLIGVPSPFSVIYPCEAIQIEYKKRNKSIYKKRSALQTPRPLK